MADERHYVQVATIHTASGTWTKPSNLVWLRVICVGAGGGGRTSGTGGGGGGGAVVESEILHASRLPETVPFTVGTSNVGGDGGASEFLDLTAPGGKAGTATGGAGGLAPWRGGAGGNPGQDGESVSMLPITTWAGGGGGAGSGSGWGGTSGEDLRIFPGLLSAGHGGSSHLPPRWPGGGGGIGQAGAGGVVTIIETLLEED